MLFLRLLAPVALLTLLTNAAPQFAGGRGRPAFSRPTVLEFPTFDAPGAPLPSGPPVVGRPVTPVTGGPVPLPSDPTARCAFPTSGRPDFSCLGKAGCPAPAVSNVKIPAGLAGPSVISFAMLGRGVQNYTCTNGSFVSAGAVAKLYDINCLSQVGDATTLPASALASLSTSAPFANTIDHYFIPNGAKAAPKFALAADRGATFNTYSLTTSVPAPNAAVDVASLQLGSTGAGPAGALGNTALRLSVAGGQPPSTCSEAGQKLSVQYAALYYFGN